MSGLAVVTVVNIWLMRASNYPGLQDGFNVRHISKVAQRLSSGLLRGSLGKGLDCVLCMVWGENLPEGEVNPNRLLTLFETWFQSHLMLDICRLFSSKD